MYMVKGPMHLLFDGVLYILLPNIFILKCSTQALCKLINAKGLKWLQVSFFETAQK